MDTDWAQLIFTPEHYEQIRQRAAARFPFSETCAEEAQTYVLEKLQENDFQRLRSFSGRCAPSTFLYRTIGSLLEDFSRRRFGYPRPPAWLRARGELYLEVWRKLHLERWPRARLIEHLEAAGHERPEIEAAISEVYRRIPRCGQITLGADVQTEPLRDTLPLTQPGPPTTQNSDYYRELLRRIGALFEPSREYDASVGDEWLESRADALTRFSQALDLSDEERVILRMLFQDGFTQGFTAFALGMTPRQLAYRRDRAVERIAAAMTEAGLDLEELREISGVYEGGG